MKPKPRKRLTATDGGTQKSDTSSRILKSQPVSDLALRTAVPVRKESHGKRTKLRPSQALPVQHKTSQRARGSQSSQRARDVWAPCDKRYAAAAAAAAARREVVDATGMTSPVALWSARVCGRMAPMRPMSLTGFERLVTDHGFKVLDLDELIGVAAGRITRTTFSYGPSNLRSVMPVAESYFAHLPARYGSGTCLDDVLRCIAFKVKHVLSAGSSSGSTSSSSSSGGGSSSSTSSLGAGLYGRALQSLQSAITSDTWTDPNVLCAAELISIYELLEGPQRNSAWESHVSGGGQLIRARGPGGFKTDYEISLLVSMVGSIVRESLLNNQICFLDEPEWQDFLEQLCLPSSGLSLRLRSYIWLAKIGATSTRFLVEMRQAISSKEPLSAEDLDDFESRCRALKAESGRWRHEYDAYLAGGDSDTSWTEVLGAGISLQAMSCRLIGALSPEDRASQEEEALCHAALMIKLLRPAWSDPSDTARFYVSQKAGVAESIFATTDAWLSGVDKDGTMSQSRVIHGSIYVAWSDYRPDG